MPSFSNGNGNYHYFLNLPKHSQIGLNTLQILCSFLKCMTVSIICGLLMHSWHFIWDYVKSNEYETFMQQKLYFEFDVLLVLWQCVLIVTICLVLVSTLYPYDTLYTIALLPSQYKYEIAKYLLLIFSLTLLCLIPIAYLTFLDEDKGMYSVFPSESAICGWLLCKFIYIRFMLIYCLYPGVMPLVLWCCWYIYYLCYLKSTVTDIQSSLHPNESSTSVNINSIDRQSSSQWSITKSPLLYQHYHQKHHRFSARYPLLLLLLWCLSFIISLLFGYVHGDPINKFFEGIYFTFSVYTCCFKFIMKKLSRICDDYRSKVSDNNYVFSIEYFMEFYWSLTYWMIYRFYTVFHAPSVRKFAITLSAHLGWEFCAVIVRYHPLYFSKSNEIIQKHYKYLYFLHDGFDCTLGIWRDRLSMDLVVKLWCSVFSGLFFALDYKVCFSMYSNQLDDKAPSTLVISYLFIATTVEFLFYVITIQFGRCVLDYNIMFPFVYYCRRLTKAHILLLVLIYGCVVIPVY